MLQLTNDFFELIVFAMIIKSEAIVLRTMDFRETSKIVTLFTKAKGKISGVCKGIRKDPKKFGSSLDLFTINTIVYYEYRRSDLHLISQADLKQYYFLIRKDYKRNMAAHYCLELIDSIMQKEQRNIKIYKLVLNYLESLETARDIDKLVHAFQIKILLLSGFSPHLDSCVKCNCKIHLKARFSLKDGGLVCSSCPTAQQSFTIISKGAISTILHVEQSSWEDCMKLGLTAHVRKELKYLLNHFLVYHLEKKIKTARFLHSAG